MDFTKAYIMAGMGSFMFLIWLILFFIYFYKFNDIIKTIDGKKFQLHYLFFIGFGVIDLFKINLKSERFSKKIKKVSEIYGMKYAEYYNYIITGAQITYAMTMAPLGISLGAITNSVEIGILGLMCSILIYAYLDMELKKNISEKHDAILSDFPVMISKLTLLVNAGMIVREAWTQIAYSGETLIYKEMQTTAEDINNGMSDMDAYNNFALRCSVKEVRKFISSLVQNLQKGNSEMVKSLKLMTAESWETKKHLVKRQGESAQQKLLFPMLMLFIGIIIMVIVPVFTNIF